MRSRFPLLAALSVLGLVAAACGAQPSPAFLVSSTPVPGYGGAATATLLPTGPTGTLMPPVTLLPLPAGTSAGGSTPTETAAVPNTGGTASGTPGTPGTLGTAVNGNGTSLVSVTINIKYGSILADGNGLTLYLFTKDTPNTSSCYGQCAATWPPFLATLGDPGVGGGLDPAKIGTTVRTDGKTQVTYNGWPLYYYVNDKQQPSIANGQGMNGAWFVVSPTGDPVK